MRIFRFCNSVHVGCEAIIVLPLTHPCKIAIIAFLNVGTRYCFQFGIGPDRRFYCVIPLLVHIYGCGAIGLNGDRVFRVFTGIYFCLQPALFIFQVYIFCQYAVLKILSPPFFQTIFIGCIGEFVLGELQYFMIGKCEWFAEYFRIDLFGRC